MRVAIALPQVPFVQGGAELMASELQKQLVMAGHQVDTFMLPFRFSPDSRVLRSIEEWRQLDVNSFDMGDVDRVIAMKFPAYFLEHPGLRVWLLHQHRSAYELAESDSSLSSDARDSIRSLDDACLSRQKQIYVISNTVGQRLKANNHLDSKTLYPPPPRLDDFCPGLVYPYLFFPSRLESLKRQDLLIHAMSLVRSPVKLLIAGQGGMCRAYANLINELGLSDRVRLLGNISHQSMVEYYRNSLAVCFTPFDEDYGFVTPEAMLCAKPVITCVDSGGPTELVVDGETGFVLDPDPAKIAESIDWLWHHRRQSVDMGMAGKERYSAMNISWKTALEHLLN